MTLPECVLDTILNEVEAMVLTSYRPSVMGILVPSMKMAPIIVDAILDMKVVLHLGDSEIDCTPEYTGVFQHSLRSQSIQIYVGKDALFIRGRAINSMLIPEQHPAFRRSFLREIRKFHEYKTLFPRLFEYRFPEIV